MSNLTKHAELELELAGVELEVRPSLMAAIEGFDSYDGHSGGSAAACTEILYQLLQFKPLSPIGASADEWFCHDTETAPFWQNKRRSSTFSRDGGKTWYDIDDPRECKGDAWAVGVACPTAQCGEIKTHYRHDYATDDDGFDIEGSTCLDCGRVNG